jgi:amino acid adenylation domain-containing protein
MNALEIITTLKNNKVVPRLDGDRLKLVGETRNLSQECIEQVKAGKEELIAFLKNAEDQFAFAPISVIPVQEYYPATNAQQRLWILCQFEGGTAAYNIIMGFYLKGLVMKENLNKAFQAVIRRHESLRTVFIEIDGAPKQVVLNHVPFNIEFEDISKVADTKSYLRAAMEASTTWQFDLENGPLIRVQLFRLSAEEHAMIFCIHHIVSDGWSVSVLVQEVMRFYESFCKNQTLVIDPLKIHYKDYTEWLYRRIDGVKGEEAKAFWKDQFSMEVDALELPADFPRPAMKSFEGAVSKFYLEDALYSKILDFCKQSQITPFNFFRATLNILLHKFSGQHDITIGTPVSGRNHFDLEPQIGLYVNTLPLKATIAPEEPFTVFLKKISGHSLRAFEFQDYPLDRIIEDLNVKRDNSRNSLFDVMMVVQNTAIGDGTININKQYGFELSLLDHYFSASETVEDKKFASKFDLNFNFDKEPDNRFFLEIEYATTLFKKARISQLFNAYRNIISQALDYPEILVKDLEIISREEKEQILYAFNSPIGEIPEYSILALMQDAFVQQPGKPAIITANVTISYQELSVYADQVTAYLLQAAGIANRAFVGLLMDRSEWTIISILGILKAGAAYVPVDVRYPAARINYIIGDAQPALLLVDDTGLSLVPENYKGRVVHINELKAYPDVVSDKRTDENDLRECCAYLIYTSGSTGTPKGVEICHRNTIAFLKWASKEFAHTDFEILYATTSYCFDLSVFEFFFPLIQGKTIRLLQSALEIADFIGADRKVMINTVPAVVRDLSDNNMSWSNVTALNMAGEAVPGRMKRELDFTAMEVRNLYGPSEDTTYSTVYRFEADGHLAVPVGTPVGYTQLYIMDKYQHLLPPGVDGEIYLSGQSVAKGYLNKAALTAEKFLENPFLPGMMMYKTGDLGRWLADGNVEFIGRMDDQVKVRGFRIEPGEIQYLLEQHQQVEQAVVMVRSMDGEPQIVAYWTGNDTITTALLKEYLAGLLPAYMIPAWWMRLEEIPLNSNGKVDKRQLPHPVAGIIPDISLVKPNTQTELQLLEIWKTVLHVEALGITHNFFDAGGHSLKATKLRSLVFKVLEKELTLNEIFAHPTIEKQARIIEAKSRTVTIPIQKAKEQAWYPISFAQERLWVLTNFGEASSAYNMPAAFRIKGNLDVKKLEAAFKQVIAKHEILRTVFTEQDAKPVQVILPPEAIKCAIEEITIDHALTAAAELQFLQERWRTVFDLEKGPLLDCFILTAGGSQLLSFNMHHMISDGWSVVVLYRDVIDAYKSLVAGNVKPLPQLALQYKDFAVWQREQLTGERLNEHRAFWKEVFQDGAPPLELPLDFYRPEIKTYNGATHRFQFKPSAAERISQLAKQAGVSLFMTLMAGVAVLLKKYANQDDLVIGTPVAGREQQQLQQQIGFYVNTLPIRTKIDGQATFLSLLMQQREAILNAFAFQEFPFETLVEELQVKRDVSRSPLFDVMVVLQNLEGLDAGSMRHVTAGLELERIVMSAGVAKYDLLFTFTEEADGLLLELEYNTSLFKSTTAEQFSKHLAVLFDQVTATPGIAIKDITLLDKSGHELLVSKADQTHVGYDTRASIISLFQRAANQFPGNIALVAGGKEITYQELDKRSGQLADILMKEYAVLPEDLVVLHFDRTEWMLIGILAVLKAGAAYIPVDPGYPAARIDYIMEDSGSRLFLFDPVPYDGIQEKWPATTFVNVTQQDYTGNTGVAAIQPDHLAYVIYTSGTTGTPKGVLIEHRNVVRLLFNEADRFDFNENDVWSLFHSYCFDFSVWEMYGALLKGGTLVMVPKEIAQDSIACYDFLQKEGITVFNQTPTAFRSLVQHNQQRFLTTPLKVRYLIFGGEALRPEILKEWHHAFPDCRNINMYGITETTVHVTYKEISIEDIKDNKSNIGLPIPTLSCYVLDVDLQQVPVGVVGELCVGGAGVARGYLNKPGLTAQKFVADPIKEGGKIYRSGDYARILASGDLEYIGRKDEQVKIRGHRIEIGEVETAFTKLEGIKDAVVLPVKVSNDEYDLVAYFISREELNSQDLRKQLNNMLPAYMVPSYLIALPAFPLNNNGKLDKAALPRPAEITGSQAGYVPCRNDMDRQIVAIWETVLEKNNIGIKDNFFDLGGHSLKAIRVISKIHEVFGIKIDLKDLFVDPTIEHLANYIATIQWMDNKNEVFAEGEDEIIF